MCKNVLYISVKHDTVFMDKETDIATMFKAKRPYYHYSLQSPLNSTWSLIISNAMKRFKLKTKEKI